MLTLVNLSSIWPHRGRTNSVELFSRENSFLKEELLGILAKAALLPETNDLRSRRIINGYGASVVGYEEGVIEDHNALANRVNKILFRTVLITSRHKILTHGRLGTNSIPRFEPGGPILSSLNEDGSNWAAGTVVDVDLRGHLLLQPLKGDPDYKNEIYRLYNVLYNVTDDKAATQTGQDTLRYEVDFLWPDVRYGKIRDAINQKVELAA